MEIVNYKIKKNKKKSKLTKKQKGWMIGVFFLIIIFLILLYLECVVNPIILSISEAKVKSATQKAVNNAVYTVLNEGNAIYDNIISITRDTNGDVELMEVNTLQINKLTRELINISQENFEQVGINGINIALGYFTGLNLFAGRGPNVNIHVVPIGVITCSFISKFESAGINQTNHSIYVNITSSASVVLPTKNQTISSTSQILLAECIIVGDVPDTYLSSASLDEMLNLVPA